MNAVHKRRLFVILMLICAGFSVVCLVLYALRQNINLFYTPTDIANGHVLTSQTIRVGGMVLNKSISREPNGVDVRFKVTDFKNTVEVDYHGVLPDLFREGQGVVIIGAMIDKQHVKASEVLAKHDASYMPREVKTALERTR